MTMSRVFRPVADRPDAAPVRHLAGHLPRILGPTDPNQLIALQRTAGNLVASSLVAVQRCGPIPPGECPCEDSGGGQAERGSAGPIEASGPQQHDAEQHDAGPGTEI